MLVPDVTLHFVFIHIIRISYNNIMSFLFFLFPAFSPLLPPLGPSAAIRQALDALRVLPQVPVRGTLSLGLPAARLDRRLQAVDARRPELDVCAGDAVAGHDGGGVVVPDGAEHVEADGREAELVAERLEREAVAGGVQLLELGDVDGGAGFLLQQVDAQAVVGRALLRDGRQPGDGELVGGCDAAEGQGGAVGRERDVGGEEVAALGEGVVGGVGDVGVEHDEGDEAGAGVKDLHAQPGRVLADEGVDDGAGGDFGVPEVELDVGDGVELGEHVGDDAELFDALGDEAVVVGAPLALGVVPVDGLVHVS